MRDRAAAVQRLASVLPQAARLVRARPILPERAMQLAPLFHRPSLHPGRVPEIRPIADLHAAYYLNGKGRPEAAVPGEATPESSPGFVPPLVAFVHAAPRVGSVGTRGFSALEMV
jgi:hypothetical protein